METSDIGVGKATNERWKRWLLRLLVLCGILSLLYFYSWWLDEARLSSPWLLFVLLAALLYGGTQMLGIWILALAARRPPAPPSRPADLTVDVFVTACGESPDIVERTLSAACAMRGAHRTWLLDDNSDPALEALAIERGAGYLTRPGFEHFKAGNVNTALGRTEGDIIIILDIDHVPRPDFLERTLGYFSDPTIGFVQVMLTFDNSNESWVARSAMETSLEYYNPSSLGADGLGAATLTGSNALIRREALVEIGGYQAGLAEDLATSLSLHAAGWHSKYVLEPLAPGISPPTFTAWFVQQLKWARGVFELLLTALPRLFTSLSWGQRLSYITRMTRYWIGPVIAFHLFATIVVLILGSPATRLAFHDYLIHLTPVVICDMLIRQASLHIWRHRSTPRTSLAGAITLVYASWPIYLLAWTMAILRVPLAFRLTPKGRSDSLKVTWLMPQISALVLLVWGILYTVRVGGQRPSFLLMAAATQAALQLMLLSRWLYSESNISRFLHEVPDRTYRARMTAMKVLPDGKPSDSVGQEPTTRSQH